jgi:Leucine-rich repeat (LRR) protein
LEQLSRITSITLEANALEGCIPESVKKWRNLIELKLSFNKLSGDLPLSFGHLKALRQLCLSNNSFTGDMPQSIGNCVSLVELQLQCNELKGHLPNLASCQLLKDCRLYDNDFIGRVPSSYWKELPELQVFSASGNTLTNVQDLNKGFESDNPSCYVSV